MGRTTWMARRGLPSILALAAGLIWTSESSAVQCPSGQIPDCFGGCIDESWLADDNCNDGPHVSLNCYVYNFDGGDCIDQCAFGEFLDCRGFCSPAGWQDDGVCDDGGWTYNGHVVDYSCAEFRFDGQDCNPCGWGAILDCNGNCAPEQWLGDNVCDDGWATHLGNPVDYSCVHYGTDEGDCL